MLSHSAPPPLGAPCRTPQGTVSDYSLRESHCSVCVVRSTSPPASPEGGSDYLFATDGSQAAALAFCSLVRQ
jgi:hypothetical protein